MGDRDQACETPMSDHVARFWELLAQERRVHVRVDTFHQEWFGGQGEWASSGFGDDCAKALVAQRDALVKALEECAASFATPPGSVAQCQRAISVEFQRRMDIARAALSATQPED